MGKILWGFSSQVLSGANPLEIAMAIIQSRSLNTLAYSGNVLTLTVLIPIWQSEQKRLKGPRKGLSSHRSGGNSNGESRTGGKGSVLNPLNN